MKSWPLCDHIARAFFPRLIPGRSLLVHQDFTHTAPVTATNHLLMWYLRDHFQCVYPVPSSTSVVYLCTGAVDGATLPEFTPELFPLEAIEAAWEHSLGCVDPGQVPTVLLCKIAYLAERGHDAEVVAEARRFAARGYRVPGHALAEARAAIASLCGIRQASGQDAGALREAQALLGA